jgi:hypothetical protein
VVEADRKSRGKNRNSWIISIAKECRENFQEGKEVFPTLYVQMISMCMLRMYVWDVCSFLALVEMIYLLLFPGNQRGLLLRKLQCE